ncbi:MAG: hypothetical protein AAGB29_09265 [Planctomycetota bacterium]
MELEDWLTDYGGELAEKRTQGGQLSDNETLLYEFWLFDTHQRNGGVAGYFCNTARDSWASLRSSAAGKVPAFSALCKQIESVILGQADPYDAVTDSGIDFDGHYARIQEVTVKELRALLADPHD